MLATDLRLQSAVLVAQTLEWEWQWWREQAYLQLHWPQRQETSSDPWMTADCQSNAEKVCKFFFILAILFLMMMMMTKQHPNLYVHKQHARKTACTPQCALCFQCFLTSAGNETCLKFT
jgi:hypothetical protein